MKLVVEGDIPHAKSTTTRPDNIELRGCYDKNTKKIIEEKYSYEIQKFEYSLNVRGR